MRYVILLVTLLSLTACGGSDGSGGNSAKGGDTAPNIIDVSNTRDTLETINIDDVCQGTSVVPPNIYVTGNNNSIDIASGCTIRVLEISGDSNYVTVATDVTFQSVNLTSQSENNVFNIPLSSSTNAYNDDGTDNTLLNFRQ